MEKIKNQVIETINSINDFDKKVSFINELKEAIHNNSPFKNEPVDCVLWIKNDSVTRNDYNPNEVAPPEMELLEISIMNDGYTQPIVGRQRDDGVCEIIDGFHRHRVGVESKIVSKQIKGYLPLVNIRQENQGKNDRIASTIRHNRARGKHKVDAMSEIVIELKNRNWTNKRIAKQLGMDDEEVLRLLQISGLQEMFKDDDFSSAWVASDSPDIENNILINEDLDADFIESIRVVNVNDEDRIFHTYHKWECHKAGLYATKVEGKTKGQCEREFADFFLVPGLFQEASNKVISEWKNSCEHYLTNKCMNRIARIGQASVCYNTKIPRIYCGGWMLLNKEDQEINNLIALEVINKRLTNNGKDEITLKEAMGGGERQVNIY